jgi:hypothetical protein
MDKSRRIRTKRLQKDFEADERRGSVHKRIRTLLFPNRYRTPGSSNDDDALFMSGIECFDFGPGRFRRKYFCYGVHVRVVVIVGNFFG